MHPRNQVDRAGVAVSGEKDEGGGPLEVLFGLLCFSIGAVVWVKAIPILWGWFAVPLGLKADAPTTTMVGLALTLDLLFRGGDVAKERASFGLLGWTFMFRAMFALLVGYALHSCTP